MPHHTLEITDNDLSTVSGGFSPGERANYRDGKAFALRSGFGPKEAQFAGLQWAKLYRDYGVVGRFPQALKLH